MRLFAGLAALITLCSAVPVDNEKTAPVANQAHPAIASYNYVASQLATVIAEIRMFDSGNPKTNSIYQHGMETLQTLKKANTEVSSGPDFDYWTTTTFMPALATLNYQIHQLKNVLTDKKPEIEKAQVQLVFYTLLKQSYVASTEMRAAVHGKMPSLVNNLTKPIINEAVDTVQQARDMFKPKSGDVDVVVVTQPDGPPIYAPNVPDYLPPPPGYNQPLDNNQPPPPDYYNQPPPNYNQPPPNYNQPPPNNNQPLPDYNQQAPSPNYNTPQPPPYNQVPPGTGGWKPPPGYVQIPPNNYQPSQNNAQEGW